MQMLSPIIRIFLLVAGTAGYLGVAVLGWGGFAAFFSHPGWRGRLEATLTSHTNGSSVESEEEQRVSIEHEIDPIGEACLRQQLLCPGGIIRHGREVGIDAERIRVEPRRRCPQDE